MYQHKLNQQWTINPNPVRKRTMETCTAIMAMARYWIRSTCTTSCTSRNRRNREIMKIIVDFRVEVRATWWRNYLKQYRSNKRSVIIRVITTRILRGRERELHRRALCRIILRTRELHLIELQQPHPSPSLHLSKQPIIQLRCRSHVHCPVR